MTAMEATLQALRDGVLVKRYDGGFNAYFGDALSLLYDRGMYQLCVAGKSGSLFVSDYGKTWMLRPKNIYDLTDGKTDGEVDELFQELFEENFGA